MTMTMTMDMHACMDQGIAVAITKDGACELHHPQVSKSLEAETALLALLHPLLQWACS